MKRLVLSLLLSSISTLPFAAMADHPPKRLLKNLMAFSALDKIFADKFNLAAIVMKGDEIIYERYNSKKGLIAIFP